MARTRKCPACDGVGDVLVTHPIKETPRHRFARTEAPTGYDQVALCLTCGGTGRTEITRKTSTGKTSPNPST